MNATAADPMRNRSVAALTDAQLDRKRTMDRKNQRESRNIRRARIKELEEEVKDLQRRLEAAESRVRIHEAREASFAQGVPDPSWCTQSIIPSAPSPHLTHLGTSACSTSSLDGCQHDFERANEPLIQHFNNSPSPTSIATGHANTPAWDLGYRSYIFPSNTMNLLLLDNIPTSTSQDIPGLQASNFGFISPDANQPFQAPGPHMYATIPIQTYFQPPLEAPIRASGPSQQASSSSLPWDRLPTHIEPTCQADTIMLDMVRTGRQRLTIANDPEALARPNFPTMSTVLDTEIQTAQKSGSSPPWTFAKCFSSLRSDTERVGIMFQLCNYVRWLIAPSRQTFHKIPANFHPTEFQLRVPHALWIDFLPWPELREAIIRQNLDPSQSDSIQQAIIRSWSFKHQHTNNQIFSFGETGDVRVAASFERYIADLNNHVITDELGQLWPFLAPVTAAIQARAVEEDERTTH